jgi:hypothetical protein
VISYWLSVEDGKTARRQDGKTARGSKGHGKAKRPRPSSMKASLGTSTLPGKGSGRRMVGRPLMIMLEACYSEDDTTSGMAVI